MNPELLRQLLRARPFIPLRIRMADGREFFVRHPELMSLSSTGRNAIIHVEAPDQVVVYLNPLLIVSAEHDPPSEPPPATGSNGPSPA